MKLLILHLSDIHIQSASDIVLRRGDAIARAVFRDLPLADAVVLLITGDIAFSGKADQYNLAGGLFTDIERTLRSESDAPVHVVMCPGNHDCDFDSGNADVRQVIVESVKKTAPDDIKDGLIDECASVQRDFFAFRNQFVTCEVGYRHKLWQTYRVIVGARSVAFHCLNVAWMSQLREQQGTLVFPTRRFEQAASTPADVSITVLHQPLNWFGQSSYRTFKQLVRRHSHLVMTGHEHTQAAALVDETESGESINIDGGVLQQHGIPSSFNIVFLDLETQEYSCAFHQWDGKGYAPVDMEASWGSFRRLPEKRRNDFSLTDEFARRLSDPGARFTHHGKEELTLDDVFVFPDMRPLDDESKASAVVDASKLRDPAGLNCGVLIRGEEKFGKTALLRQLFRSYHDRGYMPLLLNGRELDKGSEREIQKIIDSAVGRQYGNAAVARFWQLKAERRVLLVDDLDDFRFPERFFGKVIAFLAKMFELRLFTCEELFGLRELVQSEEFGGLRKLEHYRLVEFGHRRRLELVHKWASLGEGTNASAAKLVAMVDQAENVLTSVVGRNLVPSTPFFLLTLLQSAEAGAGTDLQQSALGDYYLYLILHSLELQKVRREEFGEIRNYCAHLAWFVYQSRDRQLNQSEFSQFHKAFLDRHGLAIDFDSRKRLLLEARLLEERDGALRFTYPYIYYFFLGQYLAEHLDQEHIQGAIRECCRKLYLRENGNILLFLAHHSRDKRVYETVLAVLQQQFADHKPMTLEADVEIVNRLVASTPQLIYEERDVLENRKALRNLQDEVANIPDPHGDDEENMPALVAAIVVLVKTVEILGQLLKNHYGQLEATVKQELLREVCDGSLRGMREYLETLSKESDGLVRDIEALLEKRGIERDPIRRSNKAKSAMFDILSIVGFAFVRKCAMSISSPHLHKVIEQVVEQNGTTSYRLICAAVELDNPNGLNINRIQRLNRDIASNSFAQSLLRHLVMLHIHLFRTTDHQKQMLCEELKIDVKRQQALDFHTRGTKRV